MPLTTQDFDNAEVDLQTVSAVSNSKNQVGTPIDSTTTRLGDTSDTLNGRLKKLGYIPPIAYAGGISFTALDNVKTIEEAGVIYAPRPASMPFTTSGTFAGDDDDRFFVVQGVIPSMLAAEFADVANMKTATTTSGTSIVWSDYLGRDVTTVVNNTISNEGCAKYTITNVDPGNLSTLVSGVWLGLNHDLGGGFYAVFKSGAPSLFQMGGVLGGVNLATVITEAYTAKDGIYVDSSSGSFVASGFVIPEGKFLRGFGRRSAISAEAGFNAASVVLSNYSSIENLRLTSSDGKDGGSTTQVAIYGDNISRSIVNKVWMDNLPGSSYWISNIVNNHEGNQITNYAIESCNVGVNIETRGEYINGGGGSITTCNTGLRIKGGNFNAVGSVISDNDIGVDIVAGPNDAHGQVIGALINHNGSPGDPTRRTIRVDGAANGFLFSGCQLFNGSPIELKDCHNVWFRNCVKNAVNIIEDNCTRSGFANSDLLDGIDNTPNANGNPSEVFYLDNNYPVGTDPRGSEGLGGGFLRLEQAANITSIPAGENDLDWDTVVNNALTGNLNYTVQHFYGAGGAGTGNPFVRGDVMFVRAQGPLQVSSQVTVGKSGSVAWTSADVVVKLVDSTGSTVGMYTPEQDASDSSAAETINYHFAGVVPRSSFKTVVENKTGTANITVYRHQTGTPILTYMAVQGW